MYISKYILDSNTWKMYYIASGKFLVLFLRHFMQPTQSNNTQQMPKMHEQSNSLINWVVFSNETKAYSN